MKKFTALLLLLVTFCGVSAQTASFEASPAPTQVDGVWQFAEGTKWYTIKNLDNNTYLSANSDDGNGLTLVDTAEPTSTFGSWCLVGNDNDGYRIYNRRGGADRVLVMTNNLSGTGTQSRASMGTYSESMANSTENGERSFLFVPKPSYVDGGISLCLKGTEDWDEPYYLSRQGIYLTYYSQAPDLASGFRSFAFELATTSMLKVTQEQVKKVLDDNRLNIGFIFGVSESAYVTLNTAYQASLNAEDEDAAAAALEAALKEFNEKSLVALDGDHRVIIGNRYYPDLFIRAKDTDRNGIQGAFLGAGPNVNNYRYLFTLRQKEPKSNQYAIYSDYYSKYVGGIPSADNQEFALTDEPYYYSILNGDAPGYAVIVDRTYQGTGEVPPSNALHMADWRSEHVANGIIRDNTSKWASQFRLYTEIATAYERFDSLLETEVTKYGEGIGHYPRNAGIEEAWTAYDQASLETKGARAKDLEDALRAAAILPEEGKFYSIDNTNNNAQKITENYEEKAAGRNRAQSVVPGTNLVPSLWQFEKIKDSDFDHIAPLYRIKAANSGNYMSKVYGEYASARLVPAGDANIGSYDLFDTQINRIGNGISLVHFADSARKNRGVLTASAGGYITDHVDDTTNELWIISEVNEIPVTITSVGYATLHLPFAVTVPDEVIAYAGIDKETKVTLRDIGKALPALTPVVIKSEGGGTFTFPINYDSTEDGTTIENDLLGTLTPYMPEDKTVPYYVFKQAANGNVGFYRVTTFNNPMGANKAYLSSPAGETASAVKLFGFDEITDIDSAVTNEEADETYYDLQGRRVLYPTNGVFIKGNGQKVLIR